MISFARTGLKNLSAFVKDTFGGFLPLTPLSNAGYPTNSDFTSVVPRLSYDVIPYVYDMIYSGEKDSWPLAIWRKAY